LKKTAMLLALLALAGAAQADGPGRFCALADEARSVEYPWMSIARWHQMNDALKARAAQGDVDVLFVGDSITEMWDRAEWDSHFGKLRAANFGIGGDHTGNLLWRLKNDGMEKLKPKVVVLLIGTNNFGLCNERPEHVIAGIKAVVAQLRTLYPEANVLVNGILPKGQSAADWAPAAKTQVNAALYELVEGRPVVYRDYGRLFLEPGGDIAKETMPDFLHLSPKAYGTWGDALVPDIERLMR
jgi:lysophospholipase L1-like esterase